MKIGIVGLPNVGKSTLFNALTNANVLAANYPFATIEPNVGIVPVPDDRLDKLAELYFPDKIIPATVTFVDIAGLVRGASTGQGMGNKFLSHVRECNAICQVVRAFNDDDVLHVDDKVDPATDIATINTELILADLQTVDARISKVSKESRGGATSTTIIELLGKIRATLDEGRLASAAGEDLSDISDLNLLTAKPFIYVFNVDENQIQDSELNHKLVQLVAPSPAIILCAKLEAELSELPRDEAKELLADIGQSHSGLEQLATQGFSELGLQTYLTAGPKEVRAWTVPRGTTAPQAAGVIHTDFEKGFIKAQIVSYNDLITAGSEAAAKAAGRLRLEGRDYIMQDGDVVEFRFNV